MNEQLITAKKLGTEAHANTNHLYDGKPYSTHLEMVEAWANYLLPSVYPYTTRENMELHLPILCACWLHDVIEDCRMTYNDVREATNTQIAELVYAVTNEKGKNRSQRANYKYYLEMSKVPGATFLKMCDRLANIEYSILSKSRMLKMYQEEHGVFMSKIYDARNGDFNMPLVESIMERMLREEAVYDKNIRKQMML